MHSKRCSSECCTVVAASVTFWCSEISVKTTPFERTSATPISACCNTWAAKWSFEAYVSHLWSWAKMELLGTSFAWSPILAVSRSCETPGCSVTVNLLCTHKNKNACNNYGFNMSEKSFAHKWGVCCWAELTDFYNKSIQNAFKKMPKTISMVPKGCPNEARDLQNHIM